MIVPKQLAESVDIKTPMELFEMIHNLSLFLLLDDKHDIGRFIYHNREDHYYHGKHSPHHPSPLHHWQIGVVGLLFSQLGAIMVKGQEMLKTFNAVSSGDYSQVDQDILEIVDDNNTITIDEYKKEIENIAQSSDVDLGAYNPEQKQRYQLPFPKPTYNLLRQR